MSIVSRLARRNDGIRHLFQQAELIAWKLNRRKGHIPTLAKYSLFRDYVKARNIDIVIETGTYLGDFVCAVRKDFRKIYSIELSDFLYLRATRRMKHFDNVELLQGDSSKVLPNLLEKIASPCGFWLDAHASGGITERGEKETPIEQEIRSIAQHAEARHLDHVMLIDDATNFGAIAGYPDIKDLQNVLSEYEGPWKIQRLTTDILTVTRQ